MAARQGSGPYSSSLCGRDAEVAILDQLLNRIPDRGGALVLRGDPGIGKTALLSAASAAASDKGIPVLHTAGTQSEAGLAFAGLQQLLRPVIDGLDRLPEPQHGALAAALGVSGALAPDPFLIGRLIAIAGPPGR